MKKITDTQQLKDFRAQCAGTIALVPTMGNLHEGHLSLVRLAKARADQVIVTIFVNPLQFSPGEDLDSYPRTLAEDLALLENEQVAAVFIPSEQELYPQGRDQQTQVYVPALSTQLCGATRPNFFGGIATVVTKLLLLVKPTLAVFGQKDYQQWLIINRLVVDLHLDVELVMAPIVREQDGLAMSSRNGYLSPQERQIAPRLYQSLQLLEKQILAGEQDITLLLTKTHQVLSDQFAVDYLSCRRAEDLSEQWQSGDQLIVLVAVMLGNTRLIDNILIA